MVTSKKLGVKTKMSSYKYKHWNANIS